MIPGDGRNLRAPPVAASSHPSCARTDWHGLITAGPALPIEAERSLMADGFLVVAGPPIPGGAEALSAAYDRAVASADPADVSVRSSTRVRDFVNQGPEFDPVYLHPPLLSACRTIIGRPFKLSGMLARTLEPGAPEQPLHVDVERHADGWPLVGFILMVDAFDAENGATRFVPGSHTRQHGPTAATPASDPLKPACGEAGSMIIFDGSTWHGHGANRSPRRRRSIQGAFIPREARSATDQAARLRPDTSRRIGELARYLLAL